MTTQSVLAEAVRRWAAETAEGASVREACRRVRDQVTW